MPTDSNSIPHEIRAMRESDLPAVLDSWHRSYHSHPAIAWVPTGAYLKVFRPYLELALTKPYIEAAVACSRKCEDDIYGWVAHSAHVIHYVYVKQLFRRCKLGSSLVIHAHGDTYPVDLAVTHMPRFVPRVPLRYLPDYFYTPDALEWMRKKWR